MIIIRACKSLIKILRFVGDNANKGKKERDVMLSIVEVCGQAPTFTLRLRSRMTPTTPDLFGYN